MARLVVSPQAERDSAGIVAALHGDAGAAVAARYRRDFEALFERLAMFPKSGVRRATLGRAARIAVVAPYVVVYEHHDNTVEILRIIHGRRKITRSLVRE